MHLQQQIGLITTVISFILCIINIYNVQNILIILSATIILGYMIKGSEHHLFYTLSGGFFYKPTIKITGFAKKGYENLKQEFKNNFDLGLEQEAQFTVYVNNEKVVDLQGTYNMENYNEKTLHTVFSCSKNLEALVIGMLVDKNLLDYEQKISHYWPEFSQHGKQDITLEQLLRHEAGLQELCQNITDQDLSKQLLKQNHIGKIVEKSKPFWSKSSKRSYHAITRGYVLNEIVRRVDPKNRTIGEFVEEELRKPLNLDLWFGVPDNKLNSFVDLVKIIEKRTFWCYMQGLVPNFISMKSKTNLVVTIVIQLILKFKKSLTGIDYNGKLLRQGEATSANCSTNSQSLAIISNIMANKGKFEDKQILSQKVCDLMHSEPIVRKDTVLRNLKTQMTKGGFGLFDEKAERTVDFDKYGFYGWQGMGGSIMQWHPKEKIAFSYVLNLLECDISNIKGQRLRAKIYETVQNLKKQQ